MNSPILSEHEAALPEGVAAAPPTDESKPRRRVIAKRYRIDEVLGEGGMAVVYRGWHLPLDEPIAIKVLKQEYVDNEEAVTRFLQEARAGALLRGKNVAQVLDIGRLENGPPFMVTELLQGHDLHELLEARGRLPVSTTLQLLKDVCSAVAEIHQSGIVHRDLKPANIFIARDRNGEPLIKLLDFGIAKRLDGRDLNDTKDSLGSPHYMAPEQIVSAEAVGVQADIWSLGIVLFELLTGRVPFDADTVPAQCAQVLQHPCPDPSELVPEISPMLRAVILRCLEKDPTARYSNALELRQALEECEQQPNQAAPAAELDVPITVCLPLTGNGLPLTDNDLPLTGNDVDESAPSSEPVASSRPTHVRRRRGAARITGVMVACASLLTLSLASTRDAAERAYGATEQAAQRTYSGAARAFAPHWERWVHDSPSTKAVTPVVPPVTEAPPTPPTPQIAPALPEPKVVPIRPALRKTAPRLASPVRPQPRPQPAVVRVPAPPRIAAPGPDAVEQRYALTPSSPRTTNHDLINPYPEMRLK